MFKKNKLIFLLAFVFLAAIILLSLNKNYFYPLKKPANNTSTGQEISLEFSFDKDEVLRLKYPYSSKAERTLSVLYLTEKIANNQGWEFVKKDYGEMGFLVNKIKNKENGEANNYWHYYVNDILAPIAADKYILQAGDTLSWSFQDSQMTTK